MTEPLATDMVEERVLEDPDDLVGAGGDRGSSMRLRIGLVIAATIAAAGGIYFFARESDQGAGRAAEVVHGGDLGEQNDARALSERLAPELADRGPTAGTVAPGSVPCDDSEAALPQDRAALVYSARLDWEGTPAVVLGYRVEGPSLARLLLVLAEADCRLIVTQSF